MKMLIPRLIYPTQGAWNVMMHDQNRIASRWLREYFETQAFAEMWPSHDPLAGIDSGPCSDYAPDTLAPDPADRDVCTSCFYRGPAHERKP